MKKLIVILIACSFFIFSQESNAAADTMSDLKQQILELRRESELQQKKIDALTRKFGTLQKSQRIQAQEVENIKETARTPSGSLGDFTANISATGKISFEHIEPGKNADNSFAAEDLMLYITGQVSEDIKYFSEFMINPRASDDVLSEVHNQTFRVERLYLTSNSIIPKHSIKVGLFQLFDGPIKDYHVGTNNPLPGDIIFFKNPWGGHNTLHDVYTDVGVSISGMKPPFGYTFSLTNGMGDRTPSGTDFDSIAPRGFFAKLLFVPPAIPGLSLSTMYYSGEKTADGAWGSKKDRYYISDIAYRWEDLELMGMYIRAIQTRQNGNTEFDNKGYGFLFQAKYNLTKKLAAIVRYQTITVDQDDMEIFSVGADNNIGNVEQLEVGLNYRLKPRLWLKLSYQMNDESGANIAADRIISQIAFSF